MDLFQTRHYRINKRLLSQLGQWPLQTPKERYIYRSTTMLLVGSIVLPKLIKFIECFGNLDGILRCVPVLCIHGAGACKLLNCTIKSNELTFLTNRIREDRLRKTEILDNSIMVHYAERGRQLTIAYTVSDTDRADSTSFKKDNNDLSIAYMCAALWAYLSLPMMTTILDVVAPLNQSRDRVYLYETEYFVDPDENYVYIYIHACVTMPFALGILVAHDTMLAVYVHHVCGIFAALGDRLESIGGPSTDDELGTKSKNRRDDVYDRIVTCIKIHKEAVEYATLLESSGYISAFFVVGFSMLATTMTGFMTVTNLDQPAEAVRFAAFTIGSIVHLFYPCWQGQMLMEHSRYIFTNAYNVDWYEISPRAKKLLIMIMVRSVEPCKLTAGKMFVLSMENFAAALKTSISYFTVLLSMQ